VDTSGAFDGAMRACIESATLTVIVTSSDVSSIRDTSRAVRRMAHWNVDADRVRFVLNRNGIAGGITVDEAAAAIGRPLFWEIPYDKSVPASVQVGQPAVLLAPKSSAARGIVGLARRIAGLESPADGDSLWRRVLPRRNGVALERNASA
jgi:pilus assembly protein CpaE